MTGVHVSELDRLKGYKVGAVDYVSIPVVPEVLRGKVAVLVELYLKRRELRELNRSLAQANEKLAQANVTLQAEKNRELEALNATLQRANDELERANRSLQNEVAERARAELALQEADRNKDEFLAMLAHELRNPLAPMLNAVQLMRMQPTEQQMSWAQDLIRRQLGDLTRLVDDLLDVSRITRGKITLAREPMDVQTLIERAVENVEPLIQVRGHQFTVELPEAPLRVDGDPTRLTQALANVLGNAAKYTDGGGHIDLRCEAQEGRVLIRVRDDGIGIPADLLPRIFDLFTQLDRRAGSSSGGLGIGLALVRRLVEMHGGSVSAHSDGAGRGSEFVMTLPLLRMWLPRGTERLRGRTAHRSRVTPPHPGRRRQRRRSRKSGGTAQTDWPRGLQRRQWRRGPRGRGGAPTRGGAARHRHAAARWLRGGASHPRAALGPRHDAGGSDGMGTGC